MATSGTTTFTVSANDLCMAALRGLHVYGATDVVPAADITYCMQALNIIIKSLAAKGILVWTYSELVVPMIANQATYTVGPTGTGLVANRPMRVLSGFTRDPFGNDQDISVVSRFDYNLLGQKTSSGSPNQMWYDPQFPNGIVTLYNVPSDSLSTLHIVSQRQIMDFNATTDNPDFPQECYQMLKWSLMDEVALEYDANKTTIALVAAKAMKFQEEMVSFEQENASVTFSPSVR